MSAICLFTPVVAGAAWPVVASAISSAMVALGYAVVEEDAVTVQGTHEVQICVERSQGFEQALGEEEELRFERKGIVLALRKGADGRLRVCASGQGQSEEELARAGKEAMDRFLQEFVRKRVELELKKRGFALAEETLPDGTIRLRAKKFG